MWFIYCGSVPVFLWFVAYTLLCIDSHRMMGRCSPGECSTVAVSWNEYRNPLGFCSLGWNQAIFRTPLVLSHRHFKWLPSPQHWGEGTWWSSTRECLEKGWERHMVVVYQYWQKRRRWRLKNSHAWLGWRVITLGIQDGKACKASVRTAVWIFINKNPIQKHVCMWTCVTTSASNPAGSLLTGLMLVYRCVLEIHVTCVFQCASTEKILQDLECSWSWSVLEAVVGHACLHFRLKVRFQK